MERYLVRPNRSIRLKDFDPREERIDKKAGEVESARLIARLGQLQEVLFAESRHRVLVVLQGMDTSGKDGVIRRVFESVNPAGVRVAAFKVPSAEELAHDYLWRIHKQTPGKGEMVIFNRSHYEDVLVVRVHSIVPEEVWRKRYDQINAFEQTLVEEGTTVVKFFLHISKDEQKERLQERLDQPDKTWKFNPSDLKERERWDDYMSAYEDMLNRTSTEAAPWMIVPADRKWHRDWVIASRLVEVLEGLKMAYPKPDFDPKTIQIP